MVRSLLAFRIVVVAAIVAAFGQVTLGGVVRVTESGLGCPDWPLCHGQLIPPAEAATLIEYSHRLSASALSVFVVAVAVLAWLHYRENRMVLVSALLGVALVVVAAVLGGITVLTELAWWVIVLHLGIAEALIAVLIVAAVAGWSTNDADRRSTFVGSLIRGQAAITVYAAIGVFALILFGAYVVGYGAGPACGTWPLCRGSVFPGGTADALQMAHRFTAVVVVSLALGTIPVARARRRTDPLAALMALLLLVTLAAQVILGAITVWTGFEPEAKALHLSFATLIWIFSFTLVALIYLPRPRDTVPEPAMAHERA